MAEVNGVPRAKDLNLTQVSGSCVQKSRERSRRKCNGEASIEFEVKSVADFVITCSDHTRRCSVDRSGLLCTRQLSGRGLWKPCHSELASVRKLPPFESPSPGLRVLTVARQRSSRRKLGQPAPGSLLPRLRSGSPAHRPKVPRIQVDIQAIQSARRRCFRGLARPEVPCLSSPLASATRLEIPVQVTPRTCKTRLRQRLPLRLQWETRCHGRHLQAARQDRR